MLWRRLLTRRIFVRHSSTTPGFQPKTIETVPAGLHSYLFGTKPPTTAAAQELALHLPKLRGSDIVEHFRIIASEQGSTYLSLLEHAHQHFAFDYNSRKKGNWTDRLTPKESNSTRFRPLSQITWQLREGWTRYSHDDGSVTSVPFPQEDMLFFDVEVCVRDGNLPTLAVALSDKAWYGWCSDRLVKDVEYPLSTREEHLIPIGDPDKERIVIGHNVGFDRARIRESYSRRDHQIRFMDTMSMSVSMFGMADHQRESGLTDVEPDEKPQPNPKYRAKEGWKKAWKERVTKNGLKDVAKFLLNIQMNKETRDYFVKEDISTIRGNFQNLMQYCAEDNLATALVFSKMWPMFRTRFPEDITLMGMLDMGNAYLPINQNWRKFYENNEENAKNSKLEAAWAVLQSAEQLLGMDLKQDAWMFRFADEDWYSKLFHKKKTAAFVLRNGHHYAAQEDVVTKSSLIPSIFGLVYNAYPLYKTREEGWGYLAPKSKIAEKKASHTMKEPLGIDVQQLETAVRRFSVEFGDFELPEMVDIRYSDCDFYKIPHPSGSGNVGDVISNSFYKLFDTKTLRPTRFEEQFADLFKSAKITRHWISYSKRYEEEIDLYYDDSHLQGAIAPAIRQAGTVTRRSTHKLWVTLTNESDAVSIGKGIKNMVQVPPGMKLVGADVDSQEQWLAAVFGDASVAAILPEEERYSGITPFSNMMLAGSKSDGSDLHSVVARELKINRHDAKVLNYARLYGAGQAHAEKALQKGMKADEAKEVAASLFALTKGVKLLCRELSAVGIPLLREFEEEVGELQKVVVGGKVYLPAYSSYLSKPVVQFENWILDRLKKTNPHVTAEVLPLLYNDMTHTQELYFSGYETATFNFLEQETGHQILRTPVLNCQITDALAKLPPGTADEEAYDKKYRRSVMNWVVQSSAVDFLHLLLVSMNWLCRLYNIDARFVISIHDEVRYICSEEEAPRVALALMLSHLYVRAFISQRIGIRQLPMSVAFFSQVDCDTVLRKEVTTKCHNPNGGEEIPDGINWNIADLIEMTGGSLERVADGCGRSERITA